MAKKYRLDRKNALKELTECEDKMSQDTVVGKTSHLGEAKGFERSRKYCTRDEVSVCMHTHI